MALIDQYNATIRVFRWDVKLLEKPNPPPSDFSYGGVFLIRAETVFRTHIAPEGEHDVREVATVPYSLDKLQYLLNFNDTKELLRETFEQLPLLRSCENVDSLVHEVAGDLVCKFRFSPEFLNRENSKLVIFFDLESVIEKSDIVDIMDFLHSVCNGDENLVKNLEGGDDHDDQLILEKIEEIEDYLKLHPGINAVEPRGLDEVKGAMEVKIFFEEEVENNIERTDDDDDDEQVKVCSICLERLFEGEVVAETSCSHIFHRTCVYNWLFKTNSCPMCRSSFGISV